MKPNLVLLCIVLTTFSSFPSLAKADGDKPLAGSVSDPFVEAQEKLMYAKGTYKTIMQQEDAIQNMRKATKLNLRAAQLRAKAEKLQTKADILVSKANQSALSRGLYITNPLAPVMMQPPPQAKQGTTAAASFVPVPGQPINIIVPKQEELSYQEETDTAPQTLNHF